MRNDKMIALYESCLKNRKLRLLLFILSFGGIFALLLYLNVKTPLIGDDLSYVFIFNTTERIQGASDIITSQYEHYLTWGGRTVVHIIAQILLMLPPWMMNVINASGLLILICLVYIHINYKKPYSLSLFLGIFLLLWFLLPFAETVLWITGSANYMWGTIIILTFLLPFRIYSNRGKKLSTYILQIMLMLVFGVIAGWTNENTGAAMLLIIVLFAIYYKKNGWNIPLWLYSGFVGGLIGYIFMISAPGNFVRAEGTGTTLFLLCYRIFRHTQSLLGQIGLLALAYLILSLFLRKEKDYKRNFFLSVIYGIGAIAAIYVMVLSPSFPERAWFGIIVFSIIALGTLMMSTQLKIISYIRHGFIYLGFFTLAFNLFDVYRDVNMVDTIFHEREEHIIQSKKQGLTIVNLKPYHTRTKYAVSDPTYSSLSLSKYYGIKIQYNEQ